MFRQSDDIVCDYVFPMFSGEVVAAGIQRETFLGTGFLIGCRGCALTASHVLPDTGDIFGSFIGEDLAWYGFKLEIVDRHPTEDLAFLRFIHGVWKQSVFTLAPDEAFQGMKYKFFGYPEDALYEDMSRRDSRGVISPRPDLVFSEGHVRRRIGWSPEIPGVRCTRYLELSNVTGPGCSGGPVFHTYYPGPLVVNGIYVGEKLNMGSAENAYSPNVGYALSLAPCSSWIPQGWDRSIREESRWEANESIQATTSLTARG